MRISAKAKGDIYSDMPILLTKHKKKHTHKKTTVKDGYPEIEKMKKEIFFSYLSKLICKPFIHLNIYVSKYLCI